MAGSDLSQLGVRIREERVKRGISLRELARQVGVSASMISQIETTKARPSVSTLYAITSALGMSIEEVFREPAEMVGADPAAALVAAAGRLTAGQPGAGLLSAGQPGAGLPVMSLPSPPHRLGPVVRPAERQVLRLDSGVTWEHLGELPGQAVDFLLVTYEPGGASSGSGALMRHTGSEYGLLLRGELVLTLGFEQCALHPDDAVSFDSTTPHAYRNDGSEPAVGVWFVVEQCFTG